MNLQHIIIPTALGLLPWCGLVPVVPSFAPPPPIIAPVPAPAETVPPMTPEIALLDELEKTGQTLKAFSGKVIFETEDGFLGDVTRSFGDLVYAVDPPLTTGAAPRRGVAISFNLEMDMSTRRGDTIAKTYVFRDRFLAEIDANRKTFVKREIAPPNQNFDPLKLGEGPFPLPIGQTRAEVLRRFDVQPRALPTEGLLGKLDATLVRGLRLVPKPGTKAALDFTSVDLFYDTKLWLPAGIEMIEVNGNRKTVQLTNLVRDPVLDAQVRRRLEIVTPSHQDGWRIDIEPWRQAAPDPVAPDRTTAGG